MQNLHSYFDIWLYLQRSVLNDVRMFSNLWGPNPLSNLFLKISWPLYVYTIYQGLSLFCHSLSLSSWLSNVCIFIFADYIFIMSTHKFYKISEIFIFSAFCAIFWRVNAVLMYFFRIFPSLWREKLYSDDGQWKVGKLKTFLPPAATCFDG